MLIMKYSQIFGVILCVLIAFSGNMNWIYIGSLNAHFSGLHAEGVKAGQPILINYFLMCIMVVLFLIPKVWAKRLNMFISGINGAWCLRNFIVLATCSMGECPQREMGIYVYFIAGILAFLMALLPKMQVDANAL